MPSALIRHGGRRFLLPQISVWGKPTTHFGAIRWAPLNADLAGWSKCVVAPSETRPWGSDAATCSFPHAVPNEQWCLQKHRSSIFLVGPGHACPRRKGWGCFRNRELPSSWVTAEVTAFVGRKLHSLRKGVFWGYLGGSKLLRSYPERTRRAPRWWWCRGHESVDSRLGGRAEGATGVSGEVNQRRRTKITSALHSGPTSTLRGYAGMSPWPGTPPHPRPPPP